MNDETEACVHVESGCGFLLKSHPQFLYVQKPWDLLQTYDLAHLRIVNLKLPRCSFECVSPTSPIIVSPNPLRHAFGDRKTSFQSSLRARCAALKFLRGLKVVEKYPVDSNATNIGRCETNCLLRLGWIWGNRKPTASWVEKGWTYLLSKQES